MNAELSYFEEIDRTTWQVLHRDKTLPLTLDELNSIKSLNDHISLSEVEEIYLPLINLIGIYKKASEDLTFSKSLFLQEKNKKRPFIIGISGSVAVGKSTTSRLLQILLSRTLETTTVELVTTDGFLFPNKILEERNLLHRKGFPESYNMELLLAFLAAIKNGQNYSIPIYSHEIYDIVKDKQQLVQSPDILIVEGINIFQHPKNQHLYMSDYFDLAIYVDADVSHIESWYLERFQTLLALAVENPHNYYHRFTKLPLDEVLALAKQTWVTINLANLEQYIAPTKNRAHIILHKAENHQIDKIYLNK